MKNGGPFLWSAIAICEMFMTSWQVGKQCTNSDLEHHSKDQLAPW